jgi:hypothetical protein
LNSCLCFLFIDFQFQYSFSIIRTIAASAQTPINFIVQRSFSHWLCWYFWHCTFWRVCTWVHRILRSVLTAYLQLLKTVIQIGTFWIFLVLRIYLWLIIYIAYRHLNSTVVYLSFTALNRKFSFRTLTLMFLFWKILNWLFLNLILSIKFSKNHIRGLLLLVKMLKLVFKLNLFFL